MSDIFYNTNYNILYEGIEDNNDEYRCMGMNAEYLKDISIQNLFQ